MDARTSRRIALRRSAGQHLAESARSARAGDSVMAKVWRKKAKQLAKQAERV